MKRARWTDEQADYVRRWYGKKYAHEIANDIGKSATVVKTWAARNGLRSEMHRNHQPRQHGTDFWYRLLGWWLSDVPYEEIARRHGVTYNMVNTWIARMWDRIGQ